ncbi:vomeronasal type-2 receptor 26-like [Tiliqua scincoides]|uniref:vomeronasal type-2 receptor 26-like n=1 Tax=Tiliqua scincoides TaxID=71010 RepID=UPI003463579E
MRGAGQKGLLPPNGGWNLQDGDNYKDIECDCEPKRHGCEKKAKAKAGAYTPNTIILEPFIITCTPTYLPESSDITSSGLRVVFKNYQHVLSFIFAIHEINKNLILLPNATLGFKIYDNFFNGLITYETTLDLLFKHPRNKFNYKCDKKETVLSVIAGFTVEYTIQMDSILSLYKIPQVTYGAYETPVTRNYFPTAYWNAPRNGILHSGIIWLLLHFKWTWIGLIVSDDESGEIFLQRLTPLLVQKNICVAFLERTALLQHANFHQYIQHVSSLRSTLLLSEGNVVVVSGDSQSLHALTMAIHFTEFVMKRHVGKVWITPPHWDFTNAVDVQGFASKTFHGTLSFSTATSPVPAFTDFLQNLKPDNSLKYLLCLFLPDAFQCCLNGVLKDCEHCAGEETLENMPASLLEMEMSGQSYHIYNAIYAVAHALHTIDVSGQITLRDRGKSKHLNVKPWQLHSSLKNIHFNNGAGHEVLFANEELSSGFDIINWVTFPNQSFLKIRVGTISPNKKFTISDDAIIWNSKFQQMQPHSTCVASCHLGQSRTVQEGKPVCCYDCRRCPEDTVSNQTVLVIYTFKKNWNTPIAKANNRALTCVLLSSILLCYLSSLLFIGKPGKVSCLLRQSAFGIIFSVAVSCLFAKTITVVLAFMATQPGNRMRKWLGKNVTISIVLSGSLIQVGICMTWLATSPPFPDVDMHSEIGKVTVECNEGSVIMFYSVLGYIGILALISFCVAFFARKLPDTFNEAKLITFSMFVFCTVDHGIDQESQNHVEDREEFIEFSQGGDIWQHVKNDD